MMNKDKKGMVQMRIPLIGLLFLCTFFIKAQEGKSISESSILADFSDAELKSDTKYTVAQPDFNLNKYLIESLGDVYPKGEEGKESLRVNMILEVSKAGKVNNVISLMNTKLWQSSELDKLNEVMTAMPSWVPSKKKGGDIDSKILISFTMRTSTSVLEKYTEVLKKNYYEIYDKFPDEEILEKNAKIIIESDGATHYTTEFKDSLKFYPKGTQAELNKYIEDLPEEAKGFVMERKEHVVTFRFKKVRDPSISQERLDSIKMIMASGDKFFKEVDKEASFPKGQNAFITYLKKGTSEPKKFLLTRYIQSGKKMYVGVVYGITKDGEVTGVRIVKGKEKLTAKGKESILKLFTDMPKWSPAEKLGVPVNKRYSQKVVLAIK